MSGVRRPASWAVILLPLALIGGCGGSDDKWIADRPAVAPASGVVTYNGTPVEGAQVVLSPQSEGRRPAEGQGAIGLTDASGRFTLSAFLPEPGAVPGSYRVTITKREVPQIAAAGDGHDAEETRIESKDLLPAKYKDPDTSGLTVEIPPGGRSDLKFELTDG